MLPPRHRCPWFLSGLLAGLLLGAACIYAGLSPEDGTRSALSR
jgi:hypothetical protein